jgi:hypothetical protein
MPDIAGVDPGLSLIERTSGICRTGDNGFFVGRTYIDKLSRSELLSPVTRFDCLGIDAPILPILHYNRRPVEQLFMQGAFQGRCQPGPSHVNNRTRRPLRRSGCDTAIQFATETCAHGSFPYPRVQTNHNIVEAFPNAFLGVMLDQEVIDKAQASRGQRADAYFSLSNTYGVIRELEQYLGWQDSKFWAAFQTTTNHEEIAAIVCAVTAVCAHLGKYVAVGDTYGGYFFLPPWPLWKPWARTALETERKRRDLCGIVNVWINGRVFGTNDQLPR